ncbi:MAG: tryptophan--tRNA ligase [Candidatus Babeliales bacterium]|jgi:tryptophanyl-tRNA synthetase
MSDKKKIVLTGDRPTGPLHLGHYVGSLKNRVELQRTHDQFVLIADVQALASSPGQHEKIKDNVLQVALDYCAIGIDPTQSTIFIQSLIPEIAELTMFYLNLVTVARLQRNPTVKDEVKQKGFGTNIPAGFLMHPVHQAADITVFDADLVPVGQDQVPLVEQTVEIVRSFNRIFAPVLKEPQAMVPAQGARLQGLDGKAKMSKSLGNAIYLGDSADELLRKVMSMYTDPNHAHVSDPGTVEGNVVFAYLDIFDARKDEVEELKAHYRRGGLGDTVIKKRLNEVLQGILTPIRQRREQLAKDPAAIMAMLLKGTERARGVAATTMARVRQAMKLVY